MHEHIFDAFFWLEPTSSLTSSTAISNNSSKTSSIINNNNSRNSTSTTSVYDNGRVIWHYPNDVTNIVLQYPALRQYCFPGTYTFTYN